MMEGRRYDNFSWNDVIPVGDFFSQRFYNLCTRKKN